VFDFLREKIKSLLPLTDDTSDARRQGNVFSYCLTERNTAYFGNFFVTSEAKTWQGKKQIARLGQLQFTLTKVISVAYIIITIIMYADNDKKFHPANTTCVFYSLLDFTFRHDMELGTKNLPLLFN
jgi:hypothetical protein